MKMTTRQFNKFIQLVYDNCGINLHDGKQQLLWARLSKRLRATGINSVEEYLNLIESDSHELTEFLDAISTNHTFFFRESRHFDLLEKEHQSIWCAASSSGEEPYSIAINCLEKGIKTTILATDLSANVLEMGERGIYPMERARNVTPQILKKYFKKGHGKWNGHIRVKDVLKRMVTFKKYNLVTDPTISQEFDIIFCRNVLIYFDNPVKTDVVNRLFRSLKWNGHFIIGGAESLNNIKHMYKYIKPSIYMKTQRSK
jgi:chemotaxis protein methyltransferase CheR